MSLSSKQRLFTKNIGLLILEAYRIGIGLSFGHAYRSIEEQTRLLNEGKSTTMNSKHLKRLAVDFNFFIDGILTYEKRDIQELGDYWESLNIKNKWGGNWITFIDTPHFEMK